MSIRETFLEQERDEARRALSYAHTAMRNALTELQDGDTEAAIETLKQLVGASNGAPPAAPDDQKQQLAEAADELESLQLELHGGPHDQHRPAMCLAIALMRVAAGVNADPLAHMHKHARGVPGCGEGKANG